MRSFSSSFLFVWCKVLYLCKVSGNIKVKKWCGFVGVLLELTLKVKKYGKEATQGKKHRREFVGIGQ